MKKSLYLSALFFALLTIFIGCSPTVPKPLPVLCQKPLQLKKQSFENLPFWQMQSKEAFKAAFFSFRSSCNASRVNPLFYKVCQKSDQTLLDPKQFFENYFTPYAWLDPKKEHKTFFTGYYEATLKGRINRDENYTIPLRGIPDDLIRIDLSALFPELKGKVVRGRLKNKRIVPYYTRKEIEAREPQKVLCWVKDKVELFFLQIQGSGRILLDNNQTLFVGYGDKNGHPYQSIGNYMIKHHIMPYAQMSLEGIKSWAKEHPMQIDAILNQNPSYLFFVTRNCSAKGAQGVELTAQHSCAVDTHYLPLGLPLFVNFTHPKEKIPYPSLVIAQDRGAAIKGGHRIDYFWGYGKEAEALAGHTKTWGDAILLLPKEMRF